MTCEITWNPDDKHASFSLSEANLKATKTATGNASLRATHPKNTLKRYFEIYVNDRKTYTRVGIATSGAALANYLGSDQWGWSYDGRGYKYHHGVFTACTPTYVTTDVVQIALDMDAGKVWFGRNNTWIDGGNPGAGTGPAYQDTDIKDYDIYPAGAAYDIDAAFTIRACLADQAYPPPSGFLAWDSLWPYILSGTIKEKGQPVERTVRAYIRSTGELFSSGVSNPDGTFEIDAPNDTTDLYVIALDDDAGEQYNDLIYARVKGVERT